MGDYFGKVKTLISEVMGLDTENWGEVLKEVAFSNACKCLTNSSAYNNELHLHCLKNKYLENEILTVNAPLNVLFTRSQLLSPSLFAGKLKIQPRKNSDFIVSKIGKQVIIECDHPGQKSKVWQNSLIAVMKERVVIHMNETIGTQMAKLREDVMVNKISIEQFLQAFSDQWEEETARNENLVSERYSSFKPWTNFMLNRGCFLDKVISRIDADLQCKPEWWHIDLSYVSGERQDESSSGYFFNIPIMIEHENGDNPEEEMYNLIFHRSPLKVIIFRDHNDDDREKKEEYRNWLNDKLRLFLGFLKTTNEIHEEADSTRYLFIVWARERGDGPVYWRWASDQSIIPKRWER